MKKKYCPQCGSYIPTDDIQKCLWNKDHQFTCKLCSSKLVVKTKGLIYTSLLSGVCFLVMFYVLFFNLGCNIQESITGGLIIWIPLYTILLWDFLSNCEIQKSQPQPENI